MKRVLLSGAADAGNAAVPTRAGARPGVGGP